MYKCPYPGCNYIAAHILLNSHAREHGFKTVAELQKKYGKVKSLQVPNHIARWAAAQSPGISIHQFDGIEAGIARLKKEDKKSR